MFEGFTPDAGDFLWELLFHNEKPWFEENKQRFIRSLRDPFTALSKQTYDCMAARHPEREFHLHIARIYRDARLPQPHGPYRDHLWFSLKDGAAMMYAPMFWFELSYDHCGCGMGFYSVTPAQMARYRARIDANPAEAETLVREVQALGFDIHEEQYRRPKGDRGALLNPWYNCKRPGVERRMELGGAEQKPDFPERLADAFDGLLPLYDFLREACGEADKPMR
jgi:uncharacterized protein (TIGR02453 family)